LKRTHIGKQGAGKEGPILRKAVGSFCGSLLKSAEKANRKGRPWTTNTGYQLILFCVCFLLNEVVICMHSAQSAFWHLRFVDEIL